MLIVRTGRTPFEVMLLAGVAVAGMMLTAVGTRPRSITEAMPGVVQETWQVALIVTGLVGLVGVYWPGAISTGLGVELGAIVGLGTSTAMYAIALILVGGLLAVVPASFVVAVSAAAWWRAAQILGDLRRLARAGDADIAGGSDGDR